MAKTATPEQKRRQEKETVGLMIELYCRGHHGTRKGQLCPDCAALRDYADARVDHCPHMATKTFCSACKTHCYKPEMRAHPRRHALERPPDAVPSSRDGGTAFGGDAEAEESAASPL